MSEAAACGEIDGRIGSRRRSHGHRGIGCSSNQKLSECRADAVKSNLVDKGVPADKISASGRGESELRVQTGDGVREPQNNRVTIELQ